MKKITTRTLTILAACFLLHSEGVFAQAIPTNYTVGNEVPFNVKYLGNQDGYLLFEVAINAASAGNAQLNISDRTEGELFLETFKAEPRVQKLKIEMRDNQQLNFKLVMGKNTYNKSFNVNNQRTESIVVAETAGSL